MTKPVIDSRLLVAIRDYEEHVAKAVARFEASGVPRPTSNFEWAERSIPQYGKLRDGSRYFKHGHGCRFHDGRWTIEWDFGDAGEFDRFDPDWLWDWIAAQKRGLFRSKDEYWTTLDEAIRAGLIDRDTSGLHQLSHPELEVEPRGVSAHAVEEWDAFNEPAKAPLIVRAYLDDLVADSRVPGLQYVVVDSGGVLFEYAGGWADISKARPMTLATTLMAYSMSKTLTAAAVLRLSDEGALGLDDPVSSYVDSFPYGEAPTVRQLLAHTAGVPAPIPLRWAHLTAEHDGFDERTALTAQLEKNAALKSDPGTKYAYSNLGYWLLGPVVESASGRSFSSYVTQEVLTPLGASPSELSYTVPDPALHATGYLEKYSFLNLVKRLVLDAELIGEYDGRWLRVNPHYVDGPAFGGVVGTAGGFGKFLQDQLRPASVLFGEETREIFYRPEHTVHGTEVPMTPGWHVAEADGGRHFYKEGGGGGFHCVMRLYPDRGIGTVVLTNATVFNVKGLLDALDPRFPE